MRDKKRKKKKKKKKNIYIYIYLSDEVGCVLIMPWCQPIHYLRTSFFVGRSPLVWRSCSARLET